MLPSAVTIGVHPTTTRTTSNAAISSVWRARGKMAVGRIGLALRLGALAGLAVFWACFLAKVGTRGGGQTPNFALPTLLL
jgi:hypothetical protein